MWTDTIAREDAAAKQTFTVSADQIRTVRAYVIVPAQTKAQDFSFRLTSLDEQGESDVVETGFTAPGGE